MAVTLAQVKELTTGLSSKAAQLMGQAATPKSSEVTGVGLMDDLNKTWELLTSGGAAASQQTSTSNTSYNDGRNLDNASEIGKADLEAAYRDIVAQIESMRGDITADEQNKLWTDIIKLQRDFADSRVRADELAAMAADEVISKGSADTNASGRSSDEALRLSRVAESLNNRRYYRAGAGGAATINGLEGYTPGQTVSAGYDLNTAEQRQQGRTEQYEALERQYQIARQQGLLNAPKDLMTADALMQQALAGTISQAGVDRLGQLFNQEIEWTITQPGQVATDKAMYEYQQVVSKLIVPDEIKNMLMDVFENGGDNGQVIATVLASVISPQTTMPSLSQYATLMELGRLTPYIKNGTANATDVLDVTIQQIARSGGSLGMTAAELYNQVTEGGGWQAFIDTALGTGD
jgi:hypothetical protein